MPGLGSPMVSLLGGGESSNLRDCRLIRRGRIVAFRSAKAAVPFAPRKATQRCQPCRHRSVPAAESEPGRCNRMAVLTGLLATQNFKGLNGRAPGKQLGRF